MSDRYFGRTAPVGPAGFPFGPTHQGLDVQPLLDGRGHPVPLHHIPGITAIDPESLRNPQGWDPWLVMADGRTVMQVRADHAAELLQPEAAALPSKFRLATDDEVAGALAARETEAKRMTLASRVTNLVDQVAGVAAGIADGPAQARLRTAADTARQATFAQASEEDLRAAAASLAAELAELARS